MPDQILAILSEQSTLTLAEVAAMVGKSMCAVERPAKKLGDQGKPKYIGSQKSGHRGESTREFFKIHVYLIA